MMSNMPLMAGGNTVKDTSHVVKHPINYGSSYYRLNGDLFKATTRVVTIVQLVKRCILTKSSQFGSTNKKFNGKTNVQY